MLDALEHRDTRAAYPQVSAAGPGHLRGGAGAPERPSSAAWASCRRAEGGPPGLFSTFWLPTPHAGPQMVRGGVEILVFTDWCYTVLS